jgi:hypothetical protein
MSKFAPPKAPGSLSPCVGRKDKLKSLPITHAPAKLAAFFPLNDEVNGKHLCRSFYCAAHAADIPSVKKNYSLN